MKSQVLFIDDETFFARPYLEELETAFTVHVRSEIREGVSAVSSIKGIESIVLDVMMPPPDDIVDFNFDGGLNTGLWALRVLRDQLIANALPVILLTNRNLGFVRNSVDALEFPHGLIEIRYKVETPRWLLKQLVQRSMELRNAILAQRAQA
jgi:CheY-like chemotaxis protein